MSRLELVLRGIVEELRHHNGACAPDKVLRGVEIWVSVDGRVDIRSERSRGYHERTGRGDLEEPGSVVEAFHCAMGHRGEESPEKGGPT